jgi:Holliday junction resolvasome RuvABC endonuclease subunit
MQIKFVAIDSSLRNTGIAKGYILEDGSIQVESIHLNETTKTKDKRVRANSDTIARCRETYNFCKQHIDMFEPHVIFAEAPSGSQNASGMKSYGATCQLLASLYPEVTEVTPDEVKKASVGIKTASKRQMIDWAYAAYPTLNWYWYSGKLQDKNEHVADAIAIVYAGVKTSDFKKLTTFLKNNGR